MLHLLHELHQGLDFCRYRRHAALAAAAAAVIAVATGAAAGDAGDSADAVTGRTLVQEAVIDAPVAELWQLFTASEAAAQWMAPKVQIDLRIGGEFRTSYDPNSTLDDEQTIINRVLSYLPHRMIAMQVAQAPADFPHAELLQQPWSIVTFDAIDEQRTNVRIAGLNYGEGPEWDVIYNHFAKGNTYLLHLLQEAARKEDAAAAPAAESAILDDAIIAETTVNASREALWRAWTTEQGLAEFLTPSSNIELKLGGAYELYFAQSAPEGQRGSEGCRILAYEPQRLLSFSWNAPPHLAKAREHRSWVVIELADAADDQVQVRLTHMGFAQLAAEHPEIADEFAQTRQYFQQVWPHVLDSLKARLEAPAADD